jgi:hypothetical protein
MVVDQLTVDIMRPLHRTIPATLLRPLLHSKILATVTEVALLREVHPNTLLLDPIQHSSWYHRLANSDRSNKHLNHSLRRFQILIRHLKVECL